MARQTSIGDKDQQRHKMTLELDQSLVGDLHLIAGYLGRGHSVTGLVREGAALVRDKYAKGLPFALPSQAKAPAKKGASKNSKPKNK